MFSGGLSQKKDMWSSFQTTETIWVLITVSILHVPHGFKCDFLLSCRALQLPFLIFSIFLQQKETKMKMKLVGKINFLQKCSVHRFRDVMHRNPDFSSTPTPSTIVFFFFFSFFWGDNLLQDTHENSISVEETDGNENWRASTPSSPPT